MRCESCGQEVPAIIQDGPDIWVEDDEVLDPTPDMTIDDECSCQEEDHKGEKCSARGLSENGGYCMACLFGCAP
jgi:hypothetical protein